MNHRLNAASLVVGLAASGCSLLYDPDKLPAAPIDAPADAPPDMPVDANPALLTITSVAPRDLIEGQGDGGSRRALVVVHGMNIVAGATVAITAHDGETATPMLEIDNDAVEVASDGATLVVPVKVAVDGNLGPSATVASIRLDVAVTQDAPGGPVTQSLTALDDPAPDSPVLTLQGLDELSGSPSLATDVTHRFSKIDVDTITAADNTQPLIVESTSSITVANVIAVNASDNTPGPGGGTGGLGGSGAVGSPGNDGGGPGHGIHDGGGGGFGTAGTVAPTGGGAGGSSVGKASLPTLVSPNVSSGGAGNKGTLLNIRGGNGGGGGGMIALTAAGDLTFAAIEAKGGDGTTGSNTTGGGGSGGAVLVRGATITITGAGITATGGTGGGAGGNGGDGRVRFDAAAEATTITSTPAAGYRGPMADAATPLIVRTPMPKITFDGSPGAFSYVLEDETGTNTKGPFALTMPSGGKLGVMVQPLFVGINHLCVLVTDAQTADEGRNCISVAFVP